MSELYDYIFKVVLFGDVGVGKKALSQRFMSNLFKSDSTLTIGVEFDWKILEINDKTIKLQIWRCGGEKRFRFLYNTYLLGCEGVILLYDVSRPSSLENLDEYLITIRNDIRKLAQFPIIVAGNKADLINKRKISAEQGIHFTKTRGVDAFIEISAKTGENTEEMFVVLAKLMIKNRKKNG